MAAAWFTSRGYKVTLASSGLPYDLVIDKAGRLTASAGAATNRCSLSYESTDFDLFFIITGEGHVFLVPLAGVVGHHKLTIGPASPY